MSEPRVSVVVPAYNAIGTVAATIGSVLGQTMDDLELIVIDDGSSDGTAELVEELSTGDPRMRVVRQANGGTAAARNAGIAQAVGEFVSFLDNDDLWMPRYLELMTMALDSTPEAGLSYTDAWILDDETKRIRAKTVMEFFPTVPANAPAPTLLRTMLSTNFIMSSVTVRRSVLEQVGGFDSTVSGVDDYDLWLRILLAGHSVVRAPGTSLIQRDRPDSQSKNERKMIAGHAEVLRRIGADPGLDPESRLVAAQELRRFERWTDALSGGNPLLQALYRARRLVSRLRERLGHDRKWPVEPPPEVASAFPDLNSL